MGEHDTFLFLLSLASLLTSARLLGEGARRLGLPLVVGELLAGIVLGPTVFGRIAPDAQSALFLSPVPKSMLNGYVTAAVVLLLVVAGLEVDLDVVRRRGRVALLTSVFGILFPLGGGLALGFLLPDSDVVDPRRRLLFALFVGVALSISALPVIAKTLLDLGLFKTDIGLLVMAAAMINDLIGWLCFSVLLGPLQGQATDTLALARTVGLTVGFLLVTMLLVRPALHFALGRIHKDRHTAPRRLLSLVVLVALFGASLTQAIGVHAVFGGFVIGVAAGDSPKLTERTRVVIHEFVTSIFAPVFFASLGLKVDFVRAFDARLCALVFAVACFAKVVGCTLGARAGGFRWRPAAAVGFGLNARGAMEIILATLAMEAGLIRQQFFVALVLMALLTSLISGPMMNALLRHNEHEDLGKLFRDGAFLPALSGRTPREAIEELVQAVAHKLGDLTPLAKKAVWEREEVAATGLGDDIAIPHAPVDGLKRPVLALGRSHDGIDFDAPDGKPARIVVLLLMPPRTYDLEVRILASLARVLNIPENRAKLLGASREEALGMFDQGGLRVSIAPRSPLSSLADL
jgi:Kef-type K+ transport system membrane component KefB/mannitol/fructose-specific phosphotransferase system IIA component (Ntr-type)